MRYDHFTMLPEEAFKPLGKKMTLEGGSGGGGQAAQPTQTSQVTIPEYARPYMETLLGKASAASETPYQTYGGERIAGPTAEQNAARQDVAGMGPAGGYAPGMNMAGAGGMAGLASAGAGQQYTNMATNPGAVQSFMSPYMQNAVDFQKTQAVQDYGRQLPGQQAAASRAGAFGGSRQAIVEAEGQRNLQNTLAGIQSQGTQKAYDAAQQSMQFGSEIGLRGLGQAAQAGVQAGTAMGQLGGAQQQSALDLAKNQEAFGALGGQERQARMDLAYQDFQNQQRYPYTQMGFMSDILRGSGNLAGTGGYAMYQQPPSGMQQMVGPGLLGLGMYKEFLK
jgi:hypothetical protein